MGPHRIKAPAYQGCRLNISVQTLLAEAGRAPTRAVRTAVPVFLRGEDREGEVDCMYGGETATAPSQKVIVTRFRNVSIAWRRSLIEKQISGMGQFLGLCISALGRDGLSYSISRWQPQVIRGQQEVESDLARYAWCETPVYMCISVLYE